VPVEDANNNDDDGGAIMLARTVTPWQSSTIHVLLLSTH